MDSPDYIVDIRGIHAPDGPAPASRRAAPNTNRPWLAIRWRCCGVYSRVYRNRQQTAYTGRCPRCGKAVNIRIGEGGTNHRLFEAR